MKKMLFCALVCTIVFASCTTEESPNVVSPVEETVTKTPAVEVTVPVDKVEEIREIVSQVYDAETEFFDIEKLELVTSEKTGIPVEDLKRFSIMASNDGVMTHLSPIEAKTANIMKDYFQNTELNDIDINEVRLMLSQNGVPDSIIDNVIEGIRTALITVAIFPQGDPAAMSNARKFLCGLTTSAIGALWSPMVRAIAIGCGASSGGASAFTWIAVTVAVTVFQTYYC